MISMYPKTNGRTLTLPPDQTGWRGLRRLRHAAPKGDEDIAAPFGMGGYLFLRPLLLMLWLLVASMASAAVLTTLELRVLGTRLAVTPGEVTVPRNIEGSVKVPAGWPGVEKKSTDTPATSRLPNSMKHVPVPS